MDENRASSGSAGKHVGRKKEPYDVRDFEKRHPQPPTAGHQTINPYRISAHACTWRFSLEGKPQRGQFKEVILRNGVVVRYWRFQKCTVQANQKTLFISAKTGKRANSRQAVYAAWDKADRARREFSTWQQVAIKPEEAPHMAGAVKGHIVLEEGERLQSLLEPYAPLAPAPPIARRARLRRDKSHDLKLELENIDAGDGLDYLLLDLKRERQEELATDAERWQSLEAGIILLRAENAKLAEAVAVLLRSRKGGF